MKKVITLLIPVCALLFVPLFAHAAFENITEMINSIKKIVEIVIPIVFSLILLYFFWGLGIFVLHADDGDKRDEGKQMMIWGLVALFVASAVWGLTGFIGDAIGIEQQDSIEVPSIDNN